jgi:hypothetical protein
MPYQGHRSLGIVVMTDDDEIEYTVAQMVARFGAEASEVARTLAQSARERPRLPAQAWRQIAEAIEEACDENFIQDTAPRTPSDAVRQLLALRDELKRNLMACETNRAGAISAERNIRAIKRYIAECERAATALTPRTRLAH